MGSILERLPRVLDRFLERRPRFARALARYGWLAFPVLAAFLIAGSVVDAGEENQIFYANQDGSMISIEPETGTKQTLYAGSPEGYAAAPANANSSRQLLFTVLRDGPGGMRGDLYSVDPADGTKALMQAAKPGEAFAPAGYSSDQLRVAAGHYTGGAPPGVTILSASAATVEPLEPRLSGSSSLLGPSWTCEGALYAWIKDATGKLALTAYNVTEHGKTTVYGTGKQVGPAAYYPDANTFIFSERPRGANLEESRLRLSAGTSELPVSGAEGLGIYDPSPPVPALDYKMAVMWTDGEKSGVGLLDPEGWTFEKTGVTAERGSRFPRISSDGAYAATRSGGSITVRRIDDGSLVRRIGDAQPPETAFEREG